jgi:hypothetical protein
VKAIHEQTRREIKLLESRRKSLHEKTQN